jgi:hypothetical protein
LFAAECIGDASRFSLVDNDYDEVKYSTSTVLGVVNAMTEEGGVLANAIHAIEPVTVNTNGYESNTVYDTVDNARCYLLDSWEASNLPVKVRKCSQASGSDGNYWWLRSHMQNETMQHMFMAETAISLSPVTLPTEKLMACARPCGLCFQPLPTHRQIRPFH